MPAEHFNRYGIIEAGSVDAVDNSLMVRLRVVDEIVDHEVVSRDIDDGVVLGCQLPIAVVVVDIQQLDSRICESFPSL